MIAGLRSSSSPTPSRVDLADPGVVDVAERRVLAGRAERAERPGAVRPDQPVRRLGQPVAAHDLDAEAALDLLLALPRRATGPV